MIPDMKCWYIIVNITDRFLLTKSNTGFKLFFC
nr:MAG TPA_asm: hypothetical protein [Bacteriophage sp.]